MAGGVSEEEQLRELPLFSPEEMKGTLCCCLDMHWREGMEKGRDTEISYRNKFLGEHLYIVDCFYSRFLIPWVVEQKFCCTGIRQKTYTHYFFAPV